LCIGIPFSDSSIDWRSDGHKTVIADLNWFMRWISFCDVGLVDISFTCGGINCEADINSSTLMKRLLMDMQSSDLNLKMLVQCIAFWKTSARIM